MGARVQPLRRMCGRLWRLRSAQRRRVCSPPGAGAAGRGGGADGGGAALCCGGSSRSSATPVLSPRAAVCSTRCARAGRRVSTAPGKARALFRCRRCSGKRTGPASLPARCVAGRNASSRWTGSLPPASRSSPPRRKPGPSWAPDLRVGSSPCPQVACPRGGEAGKEARRATCEVPLPLGCWCRNPNTTRGLCTKEAFP